MMADHQPLSTRPVYDLFVPPDAADRVRVVRHARTIRAAYRAYRALLYRRIRDDKVPKPVTGEPYSLLGRETQEPGVALVRSEQAFDNASHSYALAPEADREVSCSRENCLCVRFQGIEVEDRGREANALQCGAVVRVVDSGVHFICLLNGRAYRPPS